MDNRIEEIIISSFHNEMRAIVKYESGRKLTIATLDDVNSMISDLSKQTGKSLSELSKNHKVIIDPDKYEYISSNYEFIDNKIVKKIKKGEPVVAREEELPSAAPEKPEETAEYGRHRRSERHIVSDATGISESTDVEEVIDELKRLNPGAVIKFDKKERICYVSTPVEKLILPEGFYYSEKNGITNKGRTVSGLFTAIDVRRLTRELETDVEDEVEFEDDDEEIDDFGVGTVSRGKNKKNKKTKKGNSKVKKIFLTGAAIALLAGGGILGYHLAGGCKDAMKNNNADTNGEITSSIESTTIQTTQSSQYEGYEVATETPSYQYAEHSYVGYGSIVPEDSMSLQMDSINQIAYRNIADIMLFVQQGNSIGELEDFNKLCNFQNLVVAPDQFTISQLCAARNSIVINAYQNKDRDMTKSEVDSFLIQYIDYVFNNSPVLYGDNTVKRFQELSPYSKYIVSVLGKSVLQIVYNFEDEYSAISGTSYTYNEFNNRVNDVLNDATQILLSSETKTR